MERFGGERGRGTSSDSADANERPGRGSVADFVVEISGAGDRGAVVGGDESGVAPGRPAGRPSGQAVAAVTIA